MLMVIAIYTHSGVGAQETASHQAPRHRPLGYISMSRINRRHMLCSRGAVALAMIAPSRRTTKAAGANLQTLLDVYEGDGRKAMQDAIRKARTVLK
jgi:hypothetical protein